MRLRVFSLAAVCFSILALADGEASGATIFVTSLNQKIGGPGTGGCSLQEAIYSSVLHDTFDGTHGLAIDATDPDHFITTDCVLGTGNDTIVLPSKGVLRMTAFLDGDAYNPYGPTATPIILSTISIQGNGATLQWTGSGNARLFAVGPAPPGGIATPNGTASGTGNLKLKDVHVKGFHVKGGNGGGGGLGAGGAIYMQAGGLTVVNSTFDSNGAAGGNGSTGLTGGGGMGGDGGFGVENLFTSSSGGGGGGARGNGGDGGGAGGGGGGIVFSGGNATLIPGPGGYLCGGGGGNYGDFTNNDGHGASCPGGGGGGAGARADAGLPGEIYGGDGRYGGGGGGAQDQGGHGGFGGGGGDSGGTGGDGGFGGGGGGAKAGFVLSGNPGHGGAFGGDGEGNFGCGGGGAALGGAIFNDGGAVAVRNSTFHDNSVARGLAGCGAATNGRDAGGAIFSRNGSLTVADVTIEGNEATGSGGGIVVYEDGVLTSFKLQNSILANNGDHECLLHGSVTTTDSVANLITKNSFVNLFAPCPNVVATDDPQLGPLQDNAGPTPTMAITSTSSSAFGAADLATSLATDQRYVKRPQFHGPSLGAYEPCAIPAGITPCIGSSFLPPDTTTVQLTVQVSPAGGGTTSPAAGIYQEPQDTVIPLTATPNTGYAFTSWTGNVADPTSPSTTVTMSQAQTVTANFVPVASAFSPAKVWIGLKNSDDVGQRLDLLAEVFVNATKVGQGELDNVGSGRSGFSNAILETFPLGLTGDSVGATSGAQLKIRVSARRTCTGARHASGTARLWYNGLPVDSGDTRDAGSRFGATIGGTAKDYFLRSGFALSTTAGSNRSYVDAFVNTSAPCPARPFSSFGTWSATLP